MSVSHLDLFRPVYFFNGSLYDKVEDKLKYKLVKNNGELKNFMVVDITHDRVLTRDQFLEENCEKDDYGKYIYDAETIISSKDIIPESGLLKS